MEGVPRDSETYESYIVNTPLGDVGEPDDVAGPAIFLCSSLSRYVTGIVLDVCGGAYLH